MQVIQFLTVRSYKEIIFDGFFNLTELNFFCESPHREIPSENLFLSVNRQAIVISLSFYPCRYLLVGFPSEIIFRTVFPYISDGFKHREISVCSSDSWLPNICVCGPYLCCKGNEFYILYLAVYVPMCVHLAISEF